MFDKVRGVDPSLCPRVAPCGDDRGQSSLPMPLSVAIGRERRVVWDALSRAAWVHGRVINELGTSRDWRDIVVNQNGVT